MSFTAVFRSPIASLSQVAKKLDEKVVIFCSQLAKRLEVDEAQLVIEFQACLKYFELEETKEIEKIKSKKLSEEEKEEKKRQLEAEKLRKQEEKEAQKLKKQQEKEEEKLKKQQEKEAEKLKKEEEKLRKKEEKEIQKAREKQLKEAKKSEKSTPSPKSSPSAGFDFEDELVRPFNINTAFWNDGKHKTIKGEKVYLHSSGLVLILNDDEATLFGYRSSGGGVYEEQKMVADNFMPIKKWARECGIHVPSLPQEFEDEDEDELELTE